MAKVSVLLYLNPLLQSLIVLVKYELSSSRLIPPLKGSTTVCNGCVTHTHTHHKLRNKLLYEFIEAKVISK